MKIYEMTATFGKLDHETLVLRPGLNIIEAPNEWGKSTWCAFLLAMLYGVDTRAKSTRTVLADKERYQPWSGQPMSGRILLNWQGKDITIERKTRGRVPMGEFSAYETKSGLAVPQLNAGNCGQVLLGVEQSVFERAGFVRLTDLPVTRDDALRRRLNALVTTGDESGDGQKLERELKSLKNQCRYNKTGLLPKAEGELQQVQDALSEFRTMQEQSEKLAMQAETLESQEQDLRNHLMCLRNQQAQDETARVREAEERLQEADLELLKLQAVCNELPSPEEAEEKLSDLESLSEKWELILQKQQQVPPLSPPPETLEAFEGLSPRQAMEMAAADCLAYEKLRVSFFPVLVMGGVACLCAALLMFVLDWAIPGILLIGLSGGLLALGFVRRNMRSEKLRALTEKYHSQDPKQWGQEAKNYFRQAQEYAREAGRVKKAREEFNAGLAEFREEKKNLCGEKTPGEVREVWQEVAQYWASLRQAEKERDQLQKHLEDLQAMAMQEEETVSEDSRTEGEEETRERISRIQSQKQTILGRIGQYQGRMETLGTEAQLLQKQRALRSRISNLEQFQEALVIAQNALEEATAELQRRFAPRITSRARELMERMTGGRYEKLKLSEDFNLDTGTREENTLHSALWRSEGTMDQMYLSLRLAVSEALTPEAPLVLDDALVRFDGRRAGQALEILKEEGETKQVILFTCQDREGKLLPEALTEKH